MVDAHKNFSYSTVATAPVPAASGTTLVVATGEGALFPAPPFNVTIWPAGVQPLASNAEVARVTNITTDTLTITRAQEGTSARTVIAGDQIAATITAKTLTDIETDNIADKTYAEMTALSAANGFVVKQLYRITDFRTRHLILSTEDYNTGPTEALIVRALTTSALELEAYSETYPEDVIHYLLTPRATDHAGPDKGIIIYRRDTTKNIEMHMDWRAVKTRLWEDAPLSGIYISPQEVIGSSYQDFPVFNPDYFGSNVKNVHVGYRVGGVAQVVFKGQTIKVVIGDAMDPMIFEGQVLSLTTTSCCSIIAYSEIYASVVINESFVVFKQAVSNSIFSAQGATYETALDNAIYVGPGLSVEARQYAFFGVS